ncbi:MAG: hypothetical protein HQL41_15170, partial [Alphaproteobacteria bacterium]|nr:hypothetical protein [Alphaproteobacteria bacterium]
LDALLADNRPRGLGTPRLVMALLAGGLAWSTLARLDEVVVAPGLLVAERDGEMGEGVARGAPLELEGEPSATPVVELRLPFAERRRVWAGQAAMVRIAGGPGVSGRVEWIAPGVAAGPDGQAYIPVLVRLGPGAPPLSPGLPALVDLKTGDRTVLDHLLEPVLRSGREAFRGS